MKGTLWMSVGAYALACCLPALELKGNDIALGLRILAVGWSGIFAGVLGWYANPFWLLGVLLGAMGKRTGALVCGAIALLISLTVFIDMNRELPGDEGNVTKTAIVRLLPGGHLWFLSLALLPVAAVMGQPTSRSARQ